MANVQLSARLKKLANEFAEREGQFCLSDDQFRSWLRVFDALPAPERSSCATELIALALRFEREGGARVSKAVAQLYFCAAGLTSGQSASSSKKKAGW